MTYEEMIEISQKVKTKKKPSDDEHRLQCACVRWFRFAYPKLRYALFAVPNGGRRDDITGAKLKEEGATAGVSDLILLRSNRHYGALCVEMKTQKGKQSDTQKKWQVEIERMGSKYIICRSFDDFQREVVEYLKDV